MSQHRKHLGSFSKFAAHGSYQEQALKAFWSEDYPQACQLAFDGIVQKTDLQEHLKLYACWIGALKAMGDLPALRHLAVHLMRMRLKSNEHLPLALICLCHTQQLRRAWVVYNHLKTHDHDHTDSFKTEALAMFELTFLTSTGWKAAFQSFHRLCQNKKVSFFTCWNYWQESQRLGNLQATVDSLSHIFHHFPTCPIPRMATAKDLMRQKQWKQALWIFQDIVSAFPAHAHAEILLDTCHRHVLKEKSPIFERTQELESYWIAVVDAHQAQKLSQKKNILLKCPHDVTTGAHVVLCSDEKPKVRIWAHFESHAPHVDDKFLGYAIPLTRTMLFFEGYKVDFKSLHAHKIPSTELTEHRIPWHTDAKISYFTLPKNSFKRIVQKKFSIIFEEFIPHAS